MPLGIGLLLTLFVFLSLGVPLWVSPSSRFYINPIPFFVHFKATTSRARRVVFSVLLIWAMLDAILGFQIGWTISAAAMGSGGRLLISMAVFFFSLCINLLLMALVALVWDWAARRWKHRATQN